MHFRELQKLLYDERRNKEQLEAQSKSQFATKTQCKILEAELEITRSKLKQAEEAAKETPPILLSPPVRNGSYEETALKRDTRSNF